MRNIFLLVVAVNVVVFMFYYYLPAEQNTSALALPSGVQELVLLSEVDKASLTQDKVVTAGAVEEVRANNKNTVVGKKCFTIGPFKEEKQIVDFRAQIKSEIQSASIRERIEKLHWRYWVFLAEAKSRQQAVEIASGLAKKGLQDYYVISRGEFKNHVSLGHFKDKALATNRLKKVKNMGYQPKMNTIEKEYTLYWLDYMAKNGQGLNNQALEAFELEDSIHQFTRECKK